MQKLSVTLDAAKLRNLISKRSYTNKEGAAVEVQEVKFDLIEMKDESKKIVFDHEKYTLEKTHFAVAQQTKEEREANSPAVYIGEAISMKWKNDVNNIEVHDAKVVASDNEDDLPF
jgi:hypothetical protein